MSDPGTTRSARAVADFLRSLSHPQLADIRALRDAILGADPAIGEAIKWNAPSFCTTEHFATMRLHGKAGLQLILHLGVGKRAIPPGAIDDPDHLLRWLGPDRACVELGTPGSVSRVAPALQAIIRQWLRYVPKARD